MSFCLAESHLYERYDLFYLVALSVHLWMMEPDLRSAVLFDVAVVMMTCHHCHYLLP